MIQPTPSHLGRNPGTSRIPGRLIRMLQKLLDLTYLTIHDLTFLCIQRTSDMSPDKIQLLPSKVQRGVSTVVERSLMIMELDIMIIYYPIKVKNHSTILPGPKKIFAFLYLQYTFFLILFIIKKCLLLYSIDLYSISNFLPLFKVYCQRVYLKTIV